MAKKCLLPLGWYLHFFQEGKSSKSLFIHSFIQVNVSNNMEDIIDNVRNTSLPAATRRGAVPLVTGGGNDPPSLADDVERRGISGTGAPTTKMKGELIV